MRKRKGDFLTKGSSNSSTAGDISSRTAFERFAYVTSAAGDEGVAAAMVFAWSLLSVGAQARRACLAHGVSDRGVRTLECLFDEVAVVSPLACATTHMNALALLRYDKVIVLPRHQTAVLQNVDELFKLPAPAGVVQTVSHGSGARGLKEDADWHGRKPNMSRNGTVYDTLYVLAPLRESYVAFGAFLRQSGGGGGSGGGSGDGARAVADFYRGQWTHIESRFERPPFVLTKERVRLASEWLEPWNIRLHQVTSLWPELESKSEEKFTETATTTVSSSTSASSSALSPSSSSPTSSDADPVPMMLLTLCSS